MVARNSHDFVLAGAENEQNGMPLDRAQWMQMRLLRNPAAASWLYSFRACDTRGSTNCSSWAGSPL